MPTKNNSRNRRYRLLSIDDHKPLKLNDIYYEEDVTIGNLEEAVRHSVGVARDWILEVNIWDGTNILRDNRYAKDFDKLHYQIIYKPDYHDKVAKWRARRKSASQKAKRRSASQKAKRGSPKKSSSGSPKKSSPKGSSGSSKGSSGSPGTQLSNAMKQLINFSLY